MTDKVYKDAKGVLYKVGEIGELGNADRTQLSILMLPTKPGATWRKKSLAPTFSLRCGKDAAQALDAMAEQNHWQLASEAEIQYNLTERAALLDDDSESTALYSLDISERTIRCLERAGIDTVEELAAMSDDQIMRIRDMGRKGLEELTAELNRWRGAPEESREVKTLQDLGLSDNCIRVLHDMGFEDDDVDILDSFLPEEKERLQRDFPDNWNRIQEYLQLGGTDTNDGTTEESSEAANPTPTDDLPWSAAATAAADQPAEKSVPSDAVNTAANAANRSVDQERAEKNAAVISTGSQVAETAFNYGVDPETNEQLIQCAQTYMMGKMAMVMAVKRAHSLTANHKNGTFGKWCASVGISRDKGNQLVNIADNFGNIEIDGKPLVEIAPISLLAEAAKPSTPAVVRESVARGDITTHKQYKALEKQLAEERELRRQAEVGRDAAVKDVRQLEKEQAEDRQWMDSEIEKANQKVDLATKKSAEAWERVVTAEQARKQAEKERETSERLADDEIARVQRIADDATDRANIAEAKVKELESRPIEVTGADAADIARWRAEGAEQARQENAEVMAAMQEQLDDADAAQGNVVDALYIMVQQIAANCAAQLDNWSKAAACLTQDAYMDCVQQLDSLRIQILRMMMEGADNEEMS